MNLDDFLIPSSIGSPAGVSPAPSTAAPELDLSSAATSVSAIPIKTQQRIQAEELSLARASAPSVPPIEHKGGDEFSYVQRHVRKTSIDERRVSSKAVSLFRRRLTHISAAEETSRSLAPGASHHERCDGREGSSSRGCAPQLLTRRAHLPTSGATSSRAVQSRYIQPRE